MGDEHQLGRGGHANARLPQRIESLEGTRAVAVAAGGRHSLVLSAAGRVYSFGRGREGQLGYVSGHESHEQSEPRAIDALCSVRITAISAGFRHSRVVSEAGELYSFGLGASGQLGRGEDEEPQPKVVEALLGERVTAVATGRDHSLCATQSGRVFGWGRGGDARLGFELAQEVQTIPRMYAHCWHV